MLSTPSIKYHVTIVLILFHGSLASFNDCGGLFKYDTIKVSNCEGEGPCLLIRGSNATLVMSFKPSLVVSKIFVKVYGVIASINVPFPLPNPDGCKDSGLQCPLKKSMQYTYTTSIPVHKMYPKISLKIKWEMYGDDKLILCSEFDAILK